MGDLVSIIMPSYNTDKYIKQSIESVLNQTYSNWELIIVDDCSTDDTDEIVRPFLLDERIRYVKNEQNKGAALSRNRALREAKGKWIAFLDSDDLWLPSKLERQLDYMKKKGYAFTFTDYRVSLNGVWENCIRTAPDIVTIRKLYNWCYFSTITVIYDKDKIGLIQIHDLKKNSDYAMWFHALKKTDAYRLPECLSYYIKHDNSVSSGSKIKLIKYHYLLYRKGLNKGLTVSFLLTCNNILHGLWKKYRYKRPLD